MGNGLGLMQAIFRADASSNIGAGHLVRCLSLANRLADAGWNCTFAVGPQASEVFPALERSSHEIFVLAGNSSDEATQLQERWPAGFHWMILDHYERGIEFEQNCRGWARQIMVIDDMPVRKHICDVLLDQTFGRHPSEYSHLVPNGCRILTGSAYTLLRRGFAAWRSRVLDRRQSCGQLRRLLVSMGATDAANLTQTVLEGVECADLDLEVDVVLGAGAPHLAPIREKALQMTLPVRLHVDPPRIAMLMADADLAIGAAGTSSWERCCLGLPSLVVTLASNQVDIARAISKVGAARIIGDSQTLSPEAVVQALKDIGAQTSVLGRMATQAANVCDGLGTIRTMLPLQASRQASDGKEISLRFAQPEDETLMLAWQQEPSTRRFARESQVPTAREHHRWFVRRLMSETCFLTVIEHDREPAGVLRLDRVDRAVGMPAYEVSILVAQEKRRRGIARAALAIARDWLPAVELVAEILPENEASLGLFESAEYRHQEGGIYHRLPAPTTQ